MEPLKKLWDGLSLKQRVSIGVTALVILAAVYSFAHWRREQDFKPLYTGVAAEDAAAILQKIKESGSEYRLSDTGGVISVPSAKVAELRLEMAAAGLPKSGRIGFELFDKTTFGATEFVEHVNYNRALEGELERSIMSLSAIEQARVHLAAEKDSVFVESREPAKASVVVKLKPGANLTPQNVAAIQQLVGSAVEGLSADDVAVVDMRGTLLSRRKLSAEDAAADAEFSRRQRLEHELVEKINATLDPLLGHEKYHAGASIDCDPTSSEQSEETYDPTKSVMTNSKKSEEVMTGSATAGIPGTATNLPRPPTRIGGPTSTSSRRSEDISYQTSHLVRKTKIPEGSVKRISISVVLDQTVQWQGQGKDRKSVLVPPTPETLKVVHDLVAGVAGFDQQRGDQITVESLPFASTLQTEGDFTNAAPNDGGKAKPKPKNWKEQLKDPTILIFAGIGAATLLLLAAGAVFVLSRRKKKAGAEAGTHKAIPGSKEGIAHALEEGKAKAAAEAAQIAGQMEAVLAERAAEQQKADLAALASLQLPTVTTKKTELLTREIRESTKKDPTVSANVISTWLHEEQ